VRKVLAAVIVGSVLLGCAGEYKELRIRDTDGEMKTVVFPKGTITGSASKEQASQLAQIFVDSHNNTMKETDEIRKSTRTIEGSTQRLEASSQKIETSNQKILDSSQQNLETAQKTLRTIEQLSRSQGTGEIMLFYPAGVHDIKSGSLEYERLVNFIDFLSQGSRGRKILFISIGSASAFGNKNLNEKLARKRSETPKDVIDKYLINVPHDFFKVYGVGDMYSPKNVSMKEHQKYQSTRIIAFYETDQIPSLPEPVRKPW
jgi:hypothetical protein